MTLQAHPIETTEFAVPVLSKAPTWEIHHFTQGAISRPDMNVCAGIPCGPVDRPCVYFLVVSDVDRAATKASCGTSTRPTIFIRFLPSFCFSRSLRLREMSPP